MSPGPIQDRWLVDFGGASGFLGYPMGAVEEHAGTQYLQRFQGGTIYQSPITGAHETHGAIRDEWISLGGPGSEIGFPTTDETPTSDGVGRYNDFFAGSIYWHPATGGYEVHGDTRGKWLALGGTGGFLGYPLTDGIGRYNHFQGGSIYWHPSLGAFEVHGPIRDLWASLGWERGKAGYPASDQSATKDGVASFNVFEHALIVAAQDADVVELAGATGLRRSALAPVRLSTGDVRLEEGEWMQANVSISAQGHVDGETHIWTKNTFTGFTAATIVCLYDTHTNLLWRSTAHQYGVDSLMFSKGERRETWTTEVLPEDVRNSWAMAQTFHIPAGRNRFLEDLNKILDECKKALDVVKAIGGILGGSPGTSKPTVTDWEKAGGCDLSRQAARPHCVLMWRRSRSSGFR